MASEDPQNIHVSGNFHLYIAPAGTTLPTILPSVGNTNLDPAFKLSAYTTPDGTSINRTKETTEIEVHQSFNAVRKATTKVTDQFVTTFREFTQQAWIAAFGGGTFSVAAGVATFSPPGPGEEVAFSIVADSFDGSNIVRFVIAKATSGEGINIPVQRGASADLPTTFDILEPGGGVKPWSVLTNTPGMVTSA